MDGGSAHPKAATYTGQHKQRINANIHVSSRIRKKKKDFSFTTA
jgi:hypothetical protein